LGLGFGTRGADRAKLRAFGDAVERWGRDPDFRAVAREYVLLGHEAMTVRCCGITAERFVMALRSVPGLPKAYSVNPTSAQHYDAFTRGPLSAYLHLSFEQGISDGVRMVEDMGRLEEMNDDRARAFLRSFNLPGRTPTAAGAVTSVRRLLDDVQPSRPLFVREPIGARLRPHIEFIARELRVPTDPLRMTADQQRVVWDALDEHVRRADAELWRTKQVSDFLGGIWAQGYGGIYEALIGWVLWTQALARVVGSALLGAIALWLIIRYRRTVNSAAPAAASPGRDRDA
jgi:hypothetical protein